MGNGADSTVAVDHSVNRDLNINVVWVVFQVRVIKDAGNVINIISRAFKVGVQVFIVLCNDVPSFSCSSCLICTYS